MSNPGGGIPRRHVGLFGACSGLEWEATYFVDVHRLMPIPLNIASKAATTVTSQPTTYFLINDHTLQNSRLPAVTIYEAVPHAVCIVSRSVQLFEFSHKPTAKLRRTGVKRTVEMRPTDQSRTSCRAYVPSTMLYDPLLRVSCIHLAQACVM